MAPTPALIAVVITAFLCASCTTAGSPSSTPPPAVTPSTNITSTSPSATPTPTWSAEQAAAIRAVDGYRSASDQIGANPSGYTEAQMRATLEKWAGPEVVKSNVASFLSLKKRGFRYDIHTTVLTTKASRASDVGYGTEVVVTRCIDQRPARVLDKSGDEVSEAELGYRVSEYLLRQYTAQKRASDGGFRVYGLAPTKGECGPS